MPSGVQDKNPAILLIHEWTGLGPYIESRARQLADLGYVTFAMDMYGRGIRARDHQEAARLSGIYGKDKELMMGRMQAALKILKDNPHVDASKIVAIGYCFGGNAAIKLGLSGEPLAGVVSFHGMLPDITANDLKEIKTEFLVHHGADDKFIPAETVSSFQKAFQEAGAALSFTSHRGAVHAFTRPTAGGDTSTGLAYNADADKKSWKSMQNFLKKVLK